MPQILEQKLFDVELKVGDHFTPEGIPCNTTTHKNCNWEEIVKNGLESMFKEILIHGTPNVTDNTIHLILSLANRSNPHRTEVISILDDFIAATPTLTIGSRDAKPIK